jgi:hypothetical protein
MGVGVERGFGEKQKGGNHVRNSKRHWLRQSIYFPNRNTESRRSEQPAARRAQARDAEKLQEHGARNWTGVMQTSNQRLRILVLCRIGLTAVSSGEVKRMPFVFPEGTLMQTLLITFLFPQFAALYSDELI